MGLLAAWLSSTHTCETKADHKDKQFLKRLASDNADSHALRRECRAHLRTLPGAEDLSKMEKDVNGDHIFEPSIVL